MFHIPAHYATAALRQLEMPQTGSGLRLSTEGVCFWSVCARICASAFKM